ncbi:hypothetical protein DSBG_0338 [Desulfosporosinus sp. BG]|nr:hypothetical protein DSBG_0338 [Desulfosporosinus sp. BG]
MHEMIYRFVSGKYGHLFLQQALYDQLNLSDFDILFQGGDFRS